MRKIVVASTNPVKIQAALNGFQQMFPNQTFTAEGVLVPSEVSAQPMDDAETRQGAFNRAWNARLTAKDGDYWVGIEGGVEPIGQMLQAFAWVVVLSYDTETVGQSRTGTFLLPDEITRLVRQGVELGHADDQVFSRYNSKQTNGAVGILTDDLIDRTAYYEHAVLLALIPLKNTQLSFKGE